MTAKRNFEKKPLYRKVNTKARGVFHHSGSDSKYDRNTKRGKAAIKNEIKRDGMAKGVQRGLDYTPLFRFLLSNVGQHWNEVYREAASRLDKPDPIFWLVAEDFENAKDLCLIGESSYYTGLYVDDAGILQVVNPDISVNTLWPSCPCCTHTLNGKPFTNAYDDAKRFHNAEVYP